MIPKSLRVAIGIGMLAGLAAGLALSGTGQASGGAGLVVTTDSDRYGPGELVTITVSNTGSVPVQLESLDVTGLAGMMISEGLVGSSVIGPGQEVRHGWAQTDNEGGQVYDGIYRIVARGTGSESEEVVVGTTVAIRADGVTSGKPG